MSIRDNYRALQQEIAETAHACNRKIEDIKLIAVSKKQPWEFIFPLYQEGCRNFGENRIQEALPKIKQAPPDCYWHFIGPLQKNKVRKAVGPFVLIHSVDSLDLANKIAEVSKQLNLITAILLQVNTSQEQSKQGMTCEECYQNFNDFLSLPHLDVQGLMTMAPLTDNEKIIAKSFERLRRLKEALLKDYKPSNQLPHLSMGMSQDYKLAIREGATLLRIGSKIWP
ncbi:UPF0001 protein [Neochlamydia sp. TUME1]|uniref:YggS family pyridoxal phosphate-dependent enzyme n=1 Tax=Neochlamydia sp. TUME1 TaxID=1478174 RepID=UPI0005803B37|nr:YggS family pyridoxal phosphate-dependent enzyme [Neochlamydia sp. TUME1]KIC75476.1 UPF0001 protein [Neochlamydia sp. TUME1]